MSDPPAVQGSERGASANAPRESNRIGKLLVATAVGILCLILLVGSVTVWIIYHRPPPLMAVASFRADFEEGSPKPGWRYLWNPTGDIGKTNNYRDLVWNGQSYGFDETPTFPRPNPAHYMRISREGGHPAHGKNQRGDIDTYVIFAYTVTNAGFYLITNSFLIRSDGKVNGNDNLRVFINEQPVGPEIIVETKTPQPFDRPLGRLNAGDCVYVAVGPNGTDRNDHFKLDFTLMARLEKARQSKR